MTITDRQRARRKQGLGASDVPAVLGKDPFRSAYDLWLDKTGRLPEETADEAARFEVNNALEPAILQLAARRLGQPVVKPTNTFIHPGNVIMANVDGMVEKFARGQPIVEAKSTCLTGDWGDEGTDQVPDRVMIQVQMQMLCAQSGVAYVARLLSKFGFTFSLYRIPFNEGLANELLSRANAFWQNNVVRDVPPEIAASNLPDLDLLGRIDRMDNAVPVAPELVAAFLAANEARKSAEEAESVAKAKLVAALGDSERGDVPGFNVKYGFVSTNKLDAKSLEAAHPDVCAKFMKSGGYRVLRVSPIKAEKTPKGGKEKTSE